MANIIIKTKFRSPEESRSFTDEIEYSIQEYKQESIKLLKHEDYIDKNDVDFTKVIDYSTEIYKQKTNKYIKENSNYTFSNFSNNIDKNGIEIIKKKFIEAQKNGSFLYKTYISFEDGYLEKNNIISNGVINENLLKTTVRNSMIKMLNNENLKDYTFLGNIHYDTDNIHLHVYTVENGTPTRKINYDAKTEKEKYKNAKFKVTSFKKAKSEIYRSLNKDYENLKEIQNIFRDKILKSNINFKNFSKEDLEDLKNIYNKLPANKNLWQFNNKRIKYLKPQLEEFTKNYLKNYHSENFEKLNKILEKQEREYTKIYGQQKNYIFKNKVSNNYKKHRLEDIYSRTANKLLKELKEVDLFMIKGDEKLKKFSFSNIKLKKIFSFGENREKNKDNSISNNIQKSSKNIRKIDKMQKINIPNLNKNKKDFKFKDYTKYTNTSKRAKINTRSALKIFRNLTRNTDKNLRKEMMHNIKEYQKLIQKIDYKNKNLDKSID
ncbi:MAG: MobP2 family relaxase [Parvimonas sp.]|uniref:MobP2 family relaxase n=1 Tax=Parvimonas sp. TaxID=1944660 RepID=UPI002A749A33|nr:MobP2 family relaxase [Parvimonas sp.]MDY3050823.1 MobP2 family relaxase [Parvimonas sp.]